MARSRISLSFFALPLDIVAGVLNFCDVQSVFRVAACSHETMRVVSAVTPVLSMSYTLRRTEDARAAYAKLASMRSCGLRIAIQNFNFELLRVPPNTTSLVAYYRGAQPVHWPPEIPLPPRLSTLRTDLRLGQIAHLPLKHLDVDNMPDTLPSSLETFRLPCMYFPDARLPGLLSSLHRLRILSTGLLPRHWY